MLSAAVHLAAGIGLLLAPAQWAWWLGALIVNHGLITAAGLLPRCNWLGPNLTRLPPAAAVVLALNILQGFSSLVNAWLNKLVLDAVAAVVTQPSDPMTAASTIGGLLVARAGY